MKNDARKLIAERVRIARKKRKLTQLQLAADANVDQTLISKIENAKSNTPVATLATLAKVLQTSTAYLTGETDDPSPKTIFSENVEVKETINETVNRNGKEYSADEIAKNPKLGLPAEEKSNVRFGTKFIEIPLLTMATAASCGAGNGLYGVIPESTENIFVEASTFACLDDTRKPFAMPIEGDSMIGAGLEEGANAVINPAEEVTNGDAALICYDGNWLIKWVIYNPDGSVDLKPANPNYSPMHIESAYASDPSWFRIIGKVVATVKKGFPKRAF